MKLSTEKKDVPEMTWRIGLSFRARNERGRGWGRDSAFPILSVSILDSSQFL